MKKFILELVGGNHVVFSAADEDEARRIASSYLWSLVKQLREATDDEVSWYECMTKTE